MRSNNPGSPPLTVGEVATANAKSPYRYYEFRDLILCTYWFDQYCSTVPSQFSTPPVPNELGKWLKDHGAELIAGHTWRLPSEEIKVLFLLRWS